MSACAPRRLNPWGGTPDVTSRATGFFRVERIDGRWWFIDPAGNGFLSAGVNHAEDTDLKHHYNAHIWREKYGNRETWIREGVVRDLRDWGFNTLGWTQQWVSGGGGLITDWNKTFDLQHSQGFSSADYEIAGMPFVQNLRVAQIEDWNGNPIHPDVFSSDWEDFVEYQARQVCFDQADNEKLLGYFLVDIPAWLQHASGADFPSLQGLSPQERDERLYEVAHKYYETVTRHIKAQDPNHLILGDRYNGNKGIPQPVLDAARPFIDVLSIQYFTDEYQDREVMRNDLAKWSAGIDKPVLIADIGNCAPTVLNPDRTALQDHAARGNDYVQSIGRVLGEPWLVGWHWCGYIENDARGWGLKDHEDEPYGDLVDQVRAFNGAIYDDAARMSDA